MPLHWCNQLWLNLEEGCWKARLSACAGDHKLQGCTPLHFEFRGQSQQIAFKILNCTENLQPTLGTCAQTRCQQQNAHGPTKQCNLITKMCAWFCRMGQNWTFFTNPFQIGISGILGNQNICFLHPVNNDSCIRAMGTHFFFAIGSWNEQALVNKI